MSKRRMTCAVSTVLLAGCIDDSPTAPSNFEPVGHSQASSSTAYVSGCATLHVNITRSGGKDIVDLSVIDNGCGPLQLTVDTSAVKAGSKNSPVIQLPLVVTNPDSWLVEEVQLISWTDSLTAPQSLSVMWANPDSVAALADSARFWNVPDGTVSGSAQLFPRRWLHVATHKDVASFTAQVHIRGLPVEGQLPTKAPNYMPPDLFANMYDAWRVPVDIIVLRFHAGTSLAHRASALSAVDGEVIGGLARDQLDSEGFYYVRIPSLSIDTLMAGIRTLEAMPTVEWVHVFSRIEPSYRLPSDGSGFTEWGISPTAIDFTSPPDNWYLQALNLPMAWGCETGSTQTKIGIIDTGFQYHSDLQPNIRAMHPPWDTTTHGLKMAGLIGARGNNNEGTTGVMWEAGIRTYPQLERSFQEVALDLRMAAQNGERVVNLSWGRMPTGIDSVDDMMTKRAVSIIMIEMREVSGPLPLIVIAGGNYSANAYHSAFPALKDSLPDNTLVVVPAARSAFNEEGTVPTTSFVGDPYTGPAAEGPLIDVAAPGEGMIALGMNEQVAVTGASSAAAALVTGVAGLLASFDTSLTARQLKEIIVESAVNSGRAAVGLSGSYPYVDAHGALKLAASRNSSAPLCGTRLASVDTEVWAERASGWERIVTNESNVFVMNALHGGRMLDLHSYENSRFKLQGGAWAPTTYSPTEQSGLEDGGVYNSSRGYSHDGDTVAHVSIRPIRSPGGASIVYSTDSVAEMNVYLKDSSVPLVRDTMKIPYPRVVYTPVCTGHIRWSNGDEYCWSEFEAPTGEEMSNFVTTWVNGASDIYTAIGFWQISHTVGDAYDCGSDATATRTCRDVTVTKESRRSEVWLIDRSTLEWERMLSLPFHVISQSISEDGTELIQVRSSVMDSQRKYADCRIDFVTLATGNIVATRTAVPPNCIASGSISP